MWGKSIFGIKPKRKLIWRYNETLFWKLRKTLQKGSFRQTLLGLAQLELPKSFAGITKLNSI